MHIRRNLSRQGGVPQIEREPIAVVSAQEDRARVARVESGDTEAFAEIVERWQGPLVNLAYRYCRDRDLAEELAQDAFLMVYRKLSQWKGDAAFSTWLFAVATNVYRSWCRRRRLPTVPLEAIETAGEDRSPEADAEARDLGRVVRDAVLSLPARYRDALILYYFQEMDVKAAARVLGVAEGTLKSHLHRGRQMLAAHLPSEPPDAAGAKERSPWTGSIGFSSLNRN